MVNNLIKEQAEELYKQKQEMRKEISEGRSSKRNLKFLFLQTGRPYFVSFLHSHKYGLDCYIHIVKNYNITLKRWEYNRVICNKTYAKIDPIYDKCSWCEDLDSNGRKNKPIYMKLFVGYVHNFQGEVFSPEADKEYAINPVRLIEVRAGKNRSIHMQLLDDIRYGKFLRDVAILKKDGEGIDTVYSPLKFIRKDEDFLKEEEELYDKGVEVPQDTLNEWNSKTEDEIALDILSSCENVKYDLWGLPDPNEQSEEEEEVIETPKSRKALS